MSFPRFLHSKIFLALVAWRICSVFIVQTSHVPDEFWQSLEVAHKLAFDYGYLTWEWRIGIRSYLYPYLISVLYSFLKILKLDYTYLLITLPRVFQALLCSYAEYKFYVWTDSKFALFNLCINWYWYYCATRTLINSFETCLTIIALSEYPWKDNPRKNSKFLWTDSDKSLDEICEVLDNLAIRNLELIEEKVLINIQLEHLLRQGHIDLAKARYIRGKESVGMLQVPSEENDMKSLFDLETNYVKDNNKDTEIPSFDISLKKSDKEDVQDPIKWFGVLVPQSLKAAQKHFQDALYLIVKLANIQAQLSKVRSETASLKLSKKVVV